MSQSQHINDEEIKEEVLAIFEEHEEEVVDLATKIQKIEEDAKILIDMKIIAIKNRLVEDITISDEDLEQRCLEETEKATTSIVEEVKKQIEVLLQKQEVPL